MSPTVKIHPMIELVSKCLHGISTVPPDEQRKMAYYCAKEAAIFHDCELAAQLAARMPKLPEGITTEAIQKQLTDTIRYGADARTPELIWLCNNLQFLLPTPSDDACNIKSIRSNDLAPN